MEEWRKVVGGHDIYEVSSDGRIRSVTREINARTERGLVTRVYKGKEISAVSMAQGYLAFTIHHEGKRVMEKVHRAVAKAFIPNHLGLPEVNHKNGDKADNRVENLEWVTASQNVKHRFSTLGHKPHNLKACVCVNDGKAYESLTAAADAYGLWPAQVKDVCKGRVKSIAGLQFQYT